MKSFHAHIIVLVLVLADVAAADAQTRPAAPVTFRPDAADLVLVPPAEGSPARHLTPEQRAAAAALPVLQSADASPDKSIGAVSVYVRYRDPNTGELLPCAHFPVDIYQGGTAWTGGNIFLASTETDDDGGLYWTSSGNGSPVGCFLEVTVGNEAAVMLAPLMLQYRIWQSPMFAVYCGVDTEVGDLVPSGEDDNLGARVVGLAARSRSVIEVMTGDVCPRANVIVSTFSSFDSPETLWLDATRCASDTYLGAQYARIWMAAFTQAWPDEEGWSSDSPLWCPTDADPTCIQGFADWFGAQLPRYWVAWTGYPLPVTGATFEHPAPCGEAYSTQPDATVGLFAAALTDIQDVGQDLHDDLGSTHRDALALGYDEILAVARSHNHVTASHFLRQLRDDYPDIRRDLWDTAMNSGFDIDDAPPQDITGVVSSHTVGVPSADATITVSWTPPYDDASGVAGYSVEVGPAAVAPDQVQDLGDVTTWTSEVLDPGDWYITVRAVDRAGRWAAGYATLGPYTVADAGPSDLRWYARTGWDHPVVPRPTADAGASSCPDPVSLVGGALTYISVCGTNAGGDTGTKFGVQLAVDGGSVGNPVGAGPIAPLTDYWILNRSTHVGGGRHVVGALHDSGETIAEANERNNAWAWQWVWEPGTLVPDTTVTHAAPPDPEGGWDALPVSAVPSPNCDGFRFSAGGEWLGVFLQPDEAADDYGLAMCQPSSGPTDGFAVFDASSHRGAGTVNGLLVNEDPTGPADRDLAVTNRGRLDAPAGYALSVLRPQLLAFGDTVTVAQADGEQFLFRSVDVDAGNTGWVTVTVDVQPPSQRVRWYWFDSAFAAGDLGDKTAGANSGTTGRATWTFEVTQPGTCALVVLRDPADGTAPDTLTVAVGPGLPDFEPFTPFTGWPAPLVPRPAADGTPALVAAPDTLIGNADATWFNFAFRNANFTDWSWDLLHPANGNIVVDGAANLGGMGATVVDGWTTKTMNMPTPRTVRGGRHTASVILDLPGWIKELTETNNAYAEQYCWSPLELDYGAPVTRPAPPDPYGGWQDIPADSTRWFNCDGLRLPVAPGRFAAVAVMPGDSCNVDVRLHQPLQGARDGFAGSLAVSYERADRLDYVLVDFTSADAHPYDVGLVNFGGDRDCRVEATASVPLGEGSGPFGPFTLPAGRLLDVHEAYLEAGYLEIALENVSGAVDWGIALHAAGAPFQSRQSTVDSVTAFEAGAGADESLQVVVPAAGWYAVAVWKAGSADRDLAGDYRLTLRTVVSGVPGSDSPDAGVAGLVGVHPNPFNPRTTLELVMPAPGRADLAVFDARGRRVRLLWSGDLPAGRREFVWDGRDDGGRIAAAGIYLARLRRDGAAPEMRKLTLVK